MERVKAAAAVKLKLPCERCGAIHERCSGHADIYDNGDYKTGHKIGERPCTRWPMHGQQVCSTHGGRGRNRKAAQEQWEKERKMASEMSRLERAVQTFGLPITTTPQQALLDELGRTAGHVKWLGDQIAELSPKDLVWGIGSEEHTAGRGEMATEESPDVDLTKTTMLARPTAMVQMYQAERAHLVHVAKVAIQCGIAERQIKLAEEQGQMIAGAFREVVESPELALTEVQITVARLMVSKVLRTMSVTRSLPSAPANGNGHK